MGDVLQAFALGATGGGAVAAVVWWRLHELERAKRYHSVRLHTLENIATAVLVHLDLPLPANVVRHPTQGD